MQLLIEMLLRSMACGSRRLSGTWKRFGNGRTLSVVSPCRLAGIFASSLGGTGCSCLWSQTVVEAAVVGIARRFSLW